MQIQVKYHYSIYSIIISISLLISTIIFKYKRHINQSISRYTISPKIFHFTFDLYYFTAKSRIRSRIADLTHLRPSRSSLAVKETRDKVNTKPAPRRQWATLDSHPEMTHSARTAGHMTCDFADEPNEKVSVRRLIVRNGDGAAAASATRTAGDFCKLAHRSFQYARTPKQIALF